MSLLMKALEKAAKDRIDAQTEPAGATAPKAELTLEPLAADAAAAAGKAEPQLKSVTPQSVAGAAGQREQARAATVMQAGRRSAGVSAYLRAHPIIVFGTLAGIFLLAFGIYVYLQITNPGLFVRQPPPPPPAPLAQKPAATPATQGQPPIPTANVVQPAGQNAGALSPAGAAPAPGAVASAPPRPAPAPPAAPAAAAPARDKIVVSRGSAAPTLPPLLSEAYAALQSNRPDTAKRLYSQLLSTEPHSIDALLGLAAIAGQEGNSDDASRYYLRILELDPRHALAQSGLIALLGRADPLAAETRLKQLIAREPLPFLYFTLGNLYADQSQWAQAQQAYFQAHHLEQSNPDYAYNLAVGLEHLNQPKLALEFYRRALQLASSRGRANFSLPQAQERISSLASRVE
jgi:tetratricopeptide (TPR) repeat protein